MQMLVSGSIHLRKQVAKISIFKVEGGCSFEEDMGWRIKSELKTHFSSLPAPGIRVRIGFPEL